MPPDHATHDESRLAMSQKLIAIVAMTPDRIIGRDGKLPWHLPADLEFFKRITTGHPIVMGRKTYESIGRPLPKRRNIVLSRAPGWSAKGADVIHDPADLAKLPGMHGEVFIIGGAEVYAAFMPVLDEILVSHVFKDYEGDTAFPAFESDFPESEIIETHDLFEVRRYSRIRKH